MLHRCPLRLLACCLITTIGCGPDGPDTGSVEGTVTIDGEAAVNYLVKFTPSSSGRESSAVTDVTGYYELIYSTSQMGATLGSHSVTITKAPPPLNFDDSSEASVAMYTQSKVPEKYSQPGELTAEVVKGNNTIDFALESK